MNAMSERLPMTSSRRGAPVHLSISCFVLAVAVGLGCGGGGGDGAVAGLTASFAESGTPAAPNRVRLTRVSSGGELMTLEAALGGTTTSSDLYSFAFDLVLSDPTVVQYVPNSVQIGTVLTPSGGQTLAVEAVQSGGRIIVGVTKLGGGAGNGVSASEASIVRLTLKVLKVGTSMISFSGSISPSNPTGQPVALDSSGVPIGSVIFDPTPAAISGS